MKSPAQIIVCVLSKIEIFRVKINCTECNFKNENVQKVTLSTQLHHDKLSVVGFIYI